MNGKTCNAGFCDTLQRWLVAALPLLEANQQPSGRDPDSWDPWLAGVIFRFGWGVPGLSETLQLAAAISQMPEFVHGSGAIEAGNEELTEGDDLQAQIVVGEFLRQYLHASKSGAFEPQVFSDLYADLEEYLYRFDDIRIRMTIELWNVESDAAPVTLARGVVVRGLTDAERSQSQEASQGSFRYPPGIAPESIPTPELLIEVECSAGEWGIAERPKPYSVRFGTSFQKWAFGNRMLLMLRLLQQTQVWLGHARTFPGNRFLEPELDVT